MTSAPGKSVQSSLGGEAAKSPAASSLGSEATAAAQASPDSVSAPAGTTPGGTTAPVPALALYTRRRVAPLLVLGFASGLPLALTGGTLQAWATVEQVALQDIGFLTLVGSAYTLKFIWAPLIDRFAPPWLGRRRGWMLLAQLLLALGIAAMGTLSPGSSLLPLALIAAVLVF